MEIAAPHWLPLVGKALGALTTYRRPGGQVGRPALPLGSQRGRGDARPLLGRWGWGGGGGGGGCVGGCAERQ